jgi:hypothetical protein
MALNDRSRGRARNKTRNKAQELKGQIKEATGRATGNRRLGVQGSSRPDQGPPQTGRREGQGRLPAQALGGPAADQAACAKR